MLSVLRQNARELVVVWYDRIVLLNLKLVPKRALLQKQFMQEGTSFRSTVASLGAHTTAVIDFQRRHIKLINTRNGKVLRALPAQHNKSTVTAILAFRKRYLLVGCTAEIMVYDTLRAKSLGLFPIGGNDVTYLRWLDKRERLFAAGNEDSVCYVARLTEKSGSSFALEVVQRLLIQQNIQDSLDWRVLSLEYLSDRRQVLTGDTFGILTAWKLEPNEESDDDL